MTMAHCFLIWGILLLVLAALNFVIWKFFLCTRTGYETKGKVMAWGMGTIVLLIATILFMPLMLLQMDSVIESILGEMQEKVAEETREAFKPYEKAELTSILDDWLAGRGIEITDEVKQQEKFAIDTAIKYSGNKSFREAIETALKTFKIDGESVLQVNDREIASAAYNTVERYGDIVRDSKLPIPSMDLFFHPVRQASQVSSVSGVVLNDNGASEENFAKLVSRKLSKYFIIMGSVTSLVISALFFTIILLLKDPKEKADELEERRYLFEFDRRNKTTGKKISEEINQYN